MSASELSAIGSVPPAGSTRVAALDCGTNSIKLLIADLAVPVGSAAPGSEREVVRDMRMVRLGEGVDRTGMLSQAALTRVFAAIDEFVAVIEAHQVSAVRFCATSAARDAGNAADFAAGVRARLGSSPRSCREMRKQRCPSSVRRDRCQYPLLSPCWSSTSAEVPPSSYRQETTDHSTSARCG